VRQSHCGLNRAVASAYYQYPLIDVMVSLNQAVHDFWNNVSKFTWRDVQLPQADLWGCLQPSVLEMTLQNRSRSITSG
jgi:hypothetical protein